MFILLALVLTFVVVAIRISASGLELAEKVISRRSDTRSFSYRVARLGVASSVACMRVVAFIVARVRDLVSLVGSFVMVLDIIVLLVIVISVTSSIVLFADVDSLGGFIMSPAGQGVTLPSGDKANTSNVGNKPEGLSDESWNKADDIGKKIVAFACDSILNPPNGTYLLYQQGNTPVGYADCSVFVCAVFEGALNKTFGGADAPDGYDFSVNRKSDLKGYVTTYGMEDVVASKPSCKIGSTGSSIDSALPGDVLLTNGHVGIYVGKNEKGNHVMVHASTSNNPNCKGDINLEDGQKLQVGFSGVNRSYEIIRPSKILE